MSGTVEEVAGQTYGGPPPPGLSGEVKRRTTRMREAVASGLLLAPSTIVLGVMVVVPMIVLIWYSFLVDTSDKTALTLENYRRIFSNSLYLRLFAKSLWTAAAVAGIAAILAWPAGWALSRVSASKRQMLLTLVIVPYLTSFLLLIYAMFVLLGTGGPLMSALGWLGLASSDASIIYTPWATIVMLIYENLPIMIIVLYAASERVNNDLLGAAQSLGAGPLRRFVRIILPLSIPSLFTGFVLVFVPVGGAFVESAVLGGPDGLLLGNVIADQLTVTNNPPFGAALSMLLLAGILIFVAMLHGITVLSRRISVGA